MLGSSRPERELCGQGGGGGCAVQAARAYAVLLRQLRVALRPEPRRWRQCCERLAGGARLCRDACQLSYAGEGGGARAVGVGADDRARDGGAVSRTIPAETEGPCAFPTARQSLISADRLAGLCAGPVSGSALLGSAEGRAEGRRLLSRAFWAREALAPIPPTVAVASKCAHLGLGGQESLEETASSVT